MWNEIPRHLCGEAEELIQLAFEWPHLTLQYGAGGGGQYGGGGRKRQHTTGPQVWSADFVRGAEALLDRDQAPFRVDVDQKQRGS